MFFGHPQVQRYNIHIRSQVFALKGQNRVECGKVKYEGNKKMYEIGCFLTVADHIRIEQPRNELTLCEVEVYGRVAPGKSVSYYSLLN